MSLEILNNRTDNTHENEQFRRVVSIIENTFKKLGYKGLLIGNPFNDSFYKFRADAILFYDNGLVIIDFKDYQGNIKLPPNVEEFQTTKWYNESDKDRSRLEIKAGSKFINPFRQLKYYREAFYEIVEKSLFLNGFLNPSKVCIANIFSGPFEIINEIPRNIPYYKLIQESSLGDFLYDYASDNIFSNQISEELKKIFPAENWIRDFKPKPETSHEEEIIEIEGNVEIEIKTFLKTESAGILVLESMSLKDRDSWMTYLLREATNYSIPQVETWSHSSRISKKIFDRTNIQTQGVYSVIYGGSHKIEGVNDEKIENEESEENLLEIIPLKTNESIDEKALIIVHEAHLINRSLNQSELLRFGTGRLLEDIIAFLNPESSRKIIFVGDPYSLTYGKNEDSALDLNTLSELYPKSIKHYRKPIDFTYSNSKEELTIELANSIENKLFNNLSYNYDNLSLSEVNRSQIQEKLQLWFSQPLLSEPQKGILFFSKKDCLKTNQWIKRSYLKNGDKLAFGDLLIANNNITIPDDTGVQNPKRIVNGMFFTILKVKESESFSITIRQSKNPIILTFTKLYVKCLNLNSNPETDLWMLDNYFLSEDNLSKEEKIAYRIFINKKIDEEKSKNKFEDSFEYRQLLQDSRYQELTSEEKKAIEDLVKNYSRSKAKKEKVSTTEKARKTLSHYNKLYTKKIFTHLRETDPFINAVFIDYGWAITVHKALGSSYDEIIIKGHRKENDGITNDSYFRWLYSGVSSSIKTTYITHPQEISPFMNCNFEDNSTVGVISAISEEKSLLTYLNFIPETRFTEKISSIENYNVVGAICNLSSIIEEKGFLLESTKKFTDYLTKAYYSIPDSTDKHLVLNIDNKGKNKNWSVGNIRIDKLENEDTDYINNCIEVLFKSQNKSIETKSSKIDMPTDFRKDIYSVWVNDFKKNEYELHIMQSHKNQDVFLAKKLGEEIKFRVWYGTSEQSHTKGFFTKIEVLEKTNEHLTNEVRELLLKDLKK
jgi:hypothetical protein